MQFKMLSKTFISFLRVHKGYITLWTRQISMKTLEIKWLCIIPADFISKSELDNHQPAVIHQLQLLYDSKAFHLNLYEWSYVYTSDEIIQTDFTSDIRISIIWFTPRRVRSWIYRKWDIDDLNINAFSRLVFLRDYLNKLLMNKLSRSDNTSVIVKVA